MLTVKTFWKCNSHSPETQIEIRVRLRSVPQSRSSDVVLELGKTIIKIMSSVTDV